jgi:uncharacterized protein (TIGR02646 family)|tara:strand:- start:4058 stop:4678 length:621 start_codon:yes stop_codon:yes gene_type:complete
LRKISKQVGLEPASLSQFKRRNRQGNYSDLTVETRQDIRLACTIEQFYLCAYCCKQISGSSDDTMNEHVIARKTAPHKSLDYTNIVASCTTANQCDNAHGSQTLPLTPFDVECETDLDFKLSGRVVGLTDDAQKTIDVLHLDHRSLTEQRGQFVQALLLGSGIDPDDVIDDSDLIQMVIDDLAKPQDGRLEAFAPVVINVLRGWLR